MGKRRRSRHPQDDAQPTNTNSPERSSTMDDEKKVDAATVAPADDDEDAREFEALIRDIAELRDADTVVDHMDIETYRKGRRA
jgi:hypothetical protein